MLPNNKVSISIPLTPRQKQMTEHPARILHIGCGTKTGKTLALAAWLVEGILAGQACAWVGPWFQRTRMAFDTIKSLLQPLIDSGQIKATEGVLRMRQVSGAGSLDCYSGDNPQSLYGANYDRLVLDETSRQPEAIYGAALTVISATNGKLRCAFNLELGSRNWAIRNLLRVQAMTREQRARASEDFLSFPTGGDGLVDPALIELLRRQMPEPLWRALYLAEIPESDVALFRNLDRIFTGRELDGPLEGHRYVAGIDLGRKQDWTAVTVIDSETGAVVASDRYHEVSWTLQCERAAALYRKFRCGKAHVDATGIGDPVSEELSKLGIEIEPFLFTQPSRKALLEQLILACDNCQITLPASEKFLVYKHELESFEYALDGSTIRYAVPANMHDDTVMSLALAVHGWKASGSHVFGLLDWFRGIAQGILTPDGEPKTPAPVKVEAPAPITPPAPSMFTGAAPPPCPECKATCIQMCSGRLRCSQCGAMFLRPGQAPQEIQRVTRADVLSGRIQARMRRFG